MQEFARIAAHHVDAGERRVRSPALAAPIDNLTNWSNQRIDELRRIDAFDVVPEIACRTLAADHPGLELLRRRMRGELRSNALAHLGSDCMEESAEIAE